MNTSPAGVRGRGQITPRGHLSYLVRIYLGVDQNGKRKYTSKISKGSYRQAEQCLTKMLRAIDTHTFVEPAKMSTAVYLDQWLTGRQDIGFGTKEQYRAAIRTYLLPTLGHLRLDALNHQHIQGTVEALKGQGLSAGTIKYAIAVLTCAMKHAVHLGFLFRNPCQFVETPKKAPSTAVALSQADVRLILETAKDESLYALFLLLFTSGLRPQEALALTWSDVDLDRRTIHITKAMQRCGEKTTWGVSSAGTKTESSKRTLTIPDITLQALLRMRKDHHSINPLVFHTTEGTHLNHGNVCRVWKRLLVAAGLPHVKLYTTRHTHITHLLEAGVHPKVASERAGHSNITVTMNVYSHVTPEMDAGASEVVAQRLFSQ